MPRLVAFAAVIALVAAAPFERLRPVLALPGQRVSTLELVLAAAFAAVAIALLASRARPDWRTPLTAPWLALLGAIVLSAAVAPSHREVALKVAARLCAGFGVFLLAVTAVTSERRMATVVVVAAGTAAIVAVIAILEFSGQPSVLAWLNAFRDGVRVVGGKVRAGATLQYPTIAAMYFEIAYALALGLLLWLVDGPARRWAIAAAAVALLAIAEGISLTFTRAALIGVAASVATVCVLRWRVRGADTGVMLAAGAGAVSLLLPLISWSPEAVRLRMSSEGRQGWYRAAFDAPSSLSMTAGRVVAVPVTVTNTGRVTWQAGADEPFRASYHWLDGGSDRVVQYDGARTELPADVAPGESAELVLRVRAPHLPGAYRLAWDMVQEHRLWFSTEPGNTLAASPVVVTASAIPARPLPDGKGPRVLPAATVVLGRPALWRAALAEFRAHPVLGVGPDNFRLTYGAIVGAANADPRVHSNNMYLEILTGTGAVGAALFAWLLWRARGVIRRSVGELPPRAAALYSGVVAAAVAVLVHGLLDSFLTFTPIYLLMAVVLGLAAAPLVSFGGVDAHRV